MSGRLWIVSPVYFDTEAFRELHARIHATLADAAPGIPRPHRFVVIDDSAGTDPAAATLRDLGDVDIVDPPFNLGHQRAIVHALRTYADRFGPDDVVVTMDSDGEDQPSDLPRLLAAVLDHADPRIVALATRTHRKESLGFRLSYLAFRAMFRLLTGTVVRSGNFAAFRGGLVHRVIEHPSFNLSYSSTLIGLNLPIEAVPCARGSRYAGRSHMDVPRLVLHGLSMLMPFTDRIAVRALFALVATTLLCLIAAIVVGAIALLSQSAIPGWAVSTLVVLMIMSILSAGNVVVLLVVFSQSRGMSLGTIEGIDRRQAE